MKWKDKLIRDFLDSPISSDSLESLKKIIVNHSVNVHLAIFTEPFLTLIFEAKKKIESRFSVNRTIPYQKVYANDIVFVKKSGGEISGLFTVRQVQYYSNLNEERIADLEKNFSNLTFWFVDPDFIENKKHSKFLTLIMIDEVFKTQPIISGKADRAGWSLIQLSNQNTLFQNDR